MTNPLKKHFEAKTAEKKAKQQAAQSRLLAAAQASNGDNSVKTPAGDGDQFELKFFNDWKALQDIQSHEMRNAKKAELLPSYLPYIEGTLSAGESPQNDMLMKLMVWAVDVQDFNTAYDIAQFGILNDMVMPEPFTRTVAGTLAEEASTQFIKNVDDFAPVAKHEDIFEKLIQLTNGEDMHDQSRAKLYRAYAMTMEADKPSDALVAYKRALQLDDKVGVKNIISNLESKQNNDAKDEQEQNQGE